MHRAMWLGLVMLLGSSLAHAGPPPVDDLRQALTLPAGDQAAAEVTPRPGTQGDVLLGLTSHSVRIPSVVKTAVDRNNVIDGILFQPTSQPCDRAIIFLPWYKDGDTDKGEAICRTLARAGFKVFFMPLGYQFGRAPEGWGSGSYILKGGDAGHVEEWARQAVLDVQRVRRYLVTEQGIAPERIGIMGISLGGFIGALTYGVCPEIESAAILLAGGNLARYLEAGYRLGLPPIKDELDRLGLPPDQLEARLRPFDPVTYADPARGDGLLLINGTFDPVVPYPLAHDLWAAYGRPDRVLVPAGHQTAVVFTPYLLLEVVRHFDETLPVIE